MTPAEKRKLMAAAFKREGGQCFYCEKPVVLRRHIRSKRVLGPDDATLDHIITKAEGGPDDIANVVCACNRCNQLRGSAPAAEFLLRRRGNGNPVGPSRLSINTTTGLVTKVALNPTRQG